MNIELVLLVVYFMKCLNVVIVFGIVLFRCRLERNRNGCVVCVYLCLFGMFVEMFCGGFFCNIEVFL